MAIQATQRVTAVTRSLALAPQRPACPACAAPAAWQPFDLVVRLAARERLFFGVPAVVCGGCGQLRVHGDYARALAFNPADVAMAVLSDRVLRRRAGAPTA